MERSSGAAPPLSSGGSGDLESGQILTLLLEPLGESGSVVTLAGELDLSTIPQVERQLLEQVRSKPAVIVDLAALSFIDSSGIALLIQAFHAQDGCTVNTVVTKGSQVDRVFRLAGIDRVLPLFTDRARAIEDLNGAANS